MPLLTGELKMARGLGKKGALQRAFKSALIETIDENREIIEKIIADVVEDAFMSKAIKNGRKSRKVSRAKIMSLLTTPR